MPLAMSFIYIRNIIGLKAEPCGTPDLTSIKVEDCPRMTTLSLRPITYRLSQSISFPLIPMCYLKQKTVMPYYIKQNHAYIISIIKYHTNAIMYSNVIIYMHDIAKVSHLFHFIIVQMILHYLVLACFWKSIFKFWNGKLPTYFHHMPFVFNEHFHGINT